MRSKFLYFSKKYLIVLFLFSLQSGLAMASQANACLAVYDSHYYSKMLAQQNFSGLARFNGLWFEVVIPHSTENGTVLEYKQLDVWSEVLKSFESIGPEERLLAQKKLDLYKDKFNSITSIFKEIAIAHQASMKSRVKDLESFRDKIIDRARAGFLDFDSINDAMGIRLVVSGASKLVAPIFDKSLDSNPPENYQSDLISYYSSLLNLSKTQIISNVVIKGRLNDRSKNKYYRAVHLTIDMDGFPVELQIMTKSMSVWHSWDHQRAYKPKSTDMKYVERLRSYSQYWAMLVRTIEDAIVYKQNPNVINEFLKKIGIEFHYEQYPVRNYPQGLAYIDAILARIYDIKTEDKFVGDYSKGPIQNQRQLAKEFAQPGHF